MLFSGAHSRSYIYKVWRFSGFYWNQEKPLIQLSKSPSTRGASMVSGIELPNKSCYYTLLLTHKSYRADSRSEQPTRDLEQVAGRKGGPQSSLALGTISMGKESRGQATGVGAQGGRWSCCGGKRLTLAWPEKCARVGGSASSLRM